MTDLANEEVQAAGRASHGAWLLQRVMGGPQPHPACDSRVQCSHRKASHPAPPSGALAGMAVLATSLWYGGAYPPQVPDLAPTSPFPTTVTQTRLPQGGG